MATWVRRQVDASRWTVGLFAGDLTAITLFVVLGELTHGIDPIAAAGYVLTNTLWPFLFGWVVVAVPAGLYAGTPTSIRRVVVETAGVWLAADVIAQLIRATSLVSGGASVRSLFVFGLVSFGVGGPMLVIWRVGAHRFSGRRQSTALA